MKTGSTKSRNNGASNPKAKMTEEKVIELRSLWAKGEKTKTELAKMFGISHSAVCNILSYQSWIHVK